MTQRTRNVLIVFALVIFSVVALGVTSVSAGPAGQRTTINARTGKVSFIGASVANPLIVPGATASGLTNAARAQAILDVYAPQFGVASQDLSFSNELTTRDGRISRRYQQTYQGIPVFGGVLVVNMTSAGGLVSMSGKASPSLAVSTAPQISAVQAQQTAIQKAAKDFRVDASTLSASAASLWIYDERLVRDSIMAPELVYNVVVTSTVGAPIKAVVLVNASRGSISLFYNTIDNGFAKGSPYAVNVTGGLALPQSSSRVAGTADLATYTTGNTTNLPGTLLCEENDLTCTDGADTDADTAHLDAKGVYDMYFDWYGRDSLNNAGLQLKSTVHFASGYCNAFWNGEQMAYGDGCGSTIVLDDVVGHELTHGVTEFTSGMIYAYESGALNESFSDVWGEFYDLTNASGDETAGNRWVIGEELGGIRDMQDPTLFDDPDRMTSPNFYLGEGDGGGVHFNSGVNNKAVYLMVDGDTFNGFTIAGIGIDKVAQIYYDTQTTKLTPTSEYIQLYDFLQQSCTELIGTAGISATDCETVTAAVNATEMNDNARPNAVVAAVCDTGTQDVIFSDDLESGGANWTSTGDASWSLADTIQPIAGTASNYGVDLDVAGSYSLEMASDVAVPASAFLRFDHAFRFERGLDQFGTYNFDGGIVEYSTDGGTTWTQLTTINSGITYGGTLELGGDNPLEGKNAFIGNSGFGVGSTRFSLAALSGQNARFRWTIGSDIFTGTQGWWVDNVQVYACGAGGGTELVSNGGFETALTGWTVKNGIGDKVKCNTETKDVAYAGECAFRFKGGVGENSKIQQVVDLTGATFASGDTVAFNAYVNASNAATNGKYKISIVYGDATSSKIKGNLASTSGYTLATGSVNLDSGDVTKIKLLISNKSTAGKMYLDEISLTSSAAAAPSSVLPLPAPASLTGR